MRERLHTQPNDLEMARVVQETRQLLQGQREVPVSPGRSEGSVTLLCAGAALVKAAASSRGFGDVADRFAEDVVARGRGYILEFAASIGLNPELVERIVITNDALPSDVRLAGTLAVLDATATASY